MNTEPLGAAQCPAYILAGGQSARFGSDKALVTVEGKPLLLHLHLSLAALGHAVQVIADREDRYAALGLTCLLDAQPQSGPLAGLMTAVRHRRSLLGEGWLLLANCDQVEWFPEWLTLLGSASTTSASTTSACTTSAWAVTFEQAVQEECFEELPVNPAGRNAASPTRRATSSNAATYRQPIPGLYHTHMHDFVQAALSARQFSLQNLLRQVPSMALTTRNNPSQWSFNTLEELADINRKRSTRREECG